LETLLKFLFTGSLEFIRELNHTFLGEDAVAVRLEQFVGLEFNRDWAVHEDFFHDLLFGDFSPATSDVSGLDDFCLWLALFELLAKDSLGFTLIRCAFI